MGRPQRVAAFLAVKEDSHVKWHLLFTDKSGKFVTLAILDSVRGFNFLLYHKFRLGAKVREDIVRLPDKLKLQGGGGQLYLAHEACRSWPAPGICWLDDRRRHQ